MNDSDVNLFLLTRLLTPVACTFFQRLFASVSSVSSVASNQLKRRFDILSSVPRLRKSKTDFRRFPSSYAKRWCCSTFFLFAELWIGQWRTNTCHYQLPTVTAAAFTMRAGAARLWSFINCKLCARQLTACTPPGNDWLRPEWLNANSYGWHCGPMALDGLVRQPFRTFDFMLAQCSFDIIHVD